MIEFHSYASGSSGNLYTVSDSESTLLLECGLRWKKLQEALDFKTSQLAGCLVSHLHFDHSEALPELLRRGIDVYMSCQSRDKFTENGLFEYPSLHWLEPTQKIEIRPWCVLPFPSIHDSPGSLGFAISKQVAIPRRGEMFYTLVERLLFLTDTAYCAYTFPPCDIWAVECSYATDILEENVKEGRVDPHLANRMRASHMELGTLKTMLRSNDLSRLREIHLLHLSGANSDAERFKREIQEIVGVPVYV